MPKPPAIHDLGAAAGDAAAADVFDADGRCPAPGPSGARPRWPCAWRRSRGRGRAPGQRRGRLPAPPRSASDGEGAAAKADVIGGLADRISVVGPLRGLGRHRASG